MLVKKNKHFSSVICQETSPLSLGNASLNSSGFFRLYHMKKVEDVKHRLYMTSTLISIFSILKF